MGDFGFVIPMDIDKDGNGPCDKANKAKTVWEVWDHCFVTLAEFDTEREAQNFLDRLNSKPSDPSGLTR